METLWQTLVELLCIFSTVVGGSVRSIVSAREKRRQEVRRSPWNPLEYFSKSSSGCEMFMIIDVKMSFFKDVAAP